MLSDVNVPVRFRAQLYRSYKVSLILCQTYLRITNHRRHNLHRQAPFFQNSNRMAFSVDHNRKFFKRILSTLAVFKALSKLFGSQGCSDDKNYLVFPASFSLRFVDFAVQFCFRCKFSFHGIAVRLSPRVPFFFVVTTF